jgi:ABC-type transport system involved in multi-copper enzyme maturation permease subunit
VSVTDINPRQLRLICANDLRNALRSGSGLVYFVLALFFGLIVANAVISPFELLVAQSQSISPADFERSIIQFARPVVEWALAGGDTVSPDTARWVNFLLQDRPALLSAIFFILLFGTPLLIPMGAFNQTAGDIGNRGLRYLLLRTERSNIFFGRLISTMILAVAVQIIVIAIVAAYLAFKVELYDVASIAGWSLQGLIVLSVLTLPYIAICAWISASNDSPMASLVISNLAIGGVLLAAFVAGLKWDYGQAIAWLMPWGIQKNLFRPELSNVIVTIIVCLLYTAIFAWLGARKFSTRDL